MARQLLFEMQKKKKQLEQKMEQSRFRDKNIFGELKEDAKKTIYILDVSALAETEICADGQWTSVLQFVVSELESVLQHRSQDCTSAAVFNIMAFGDQEITKVGSCF